MGQGGGDLPGTPEKTLWGNQAAVAKLTSLLTNTFVNEARMSYQRNNGGATVSVPPDGCPNAGHLSGLQGCGSPSQLGLVPLVPDFYEPPTIIDLIDNFTLFGGLLPFEGPTNQVQLADQISWSHGKHGIRAGYEYEWTDWPLRTRDSSKALMVSAGSVPGLNGFRPEGSGSHRPSIWDVGCLFCVKGVTGENGITHFYHLNNQDAYVLDDWKVSSRLTLNIGLRWEYDGLLSDSLRTAHSSWLDRMAATADVPTSLAAALNDPAAVQQYVVPSNFAKFGHGAPPLASASQLTRTQSKGMLRTATSPRDSDLPGSHYREESSLCAAA